MQTKTQPIALDDALVDLVGVLGRPDTIGEVYDIGGPEVLTYLDMMVIASRVMERHRVIVAVPLLSPRLSSHWLRLITDVDLTTARALVDSLTNEVVVHDHRLDELLGHTPMRFAEAAAKALAGAGGSSGGRRGPYAPLTLLVPFLRASDCRWAGGALATSPTTLPPCPQRGIWSARSKRSVTPSGSRAAMSDGPASRDEACGAWDWCCETVLVFAHAACRRRRGRGSRGDRCAVAC